MPPIERSGAFFYARLARVLQEQAPLFSPPLWEPAFRRVRQQGLTCRPNGYRFIPYTKKRPGSCESGRFFCRMKARLLGFHAFQRDVQAQSLVLAWGFDTEVLQVDGGGRVEASALAAPWILAFTVERGLERYRLGHAVQGQVAGHVSSRVAGWHHFGRLEGRFRVLAHVQEIFAGDVLVAFGVVGEQACGFQGNVNFAVCRLGCVPRKGAAPVLESTVNEAEAQVADFPVDEGVLAFLVDGVVSSHGLAGSQQGSTESQCSEGLFQHAFYSF